MAWHGMQVYCDIVTIVHMPLIGQTASRSLCHQYCKVVPNLSDKHGFALPETGGRTLANQLIRTQRNLQSTTQRQLQVSLGTPSKLAIHLLDVPILI